MSLPVRLVLWILVFFSHHVYGLPSVAFYYGENVPVPKLCMYDVVIVDPYSNFQPDTYCSSMSEPLAYVSLGEVRKGVSYEKDIKSEWVIGKNVAWNKNIIIDQTQEAWQRYFIDNLITPLWEKGYRGFFLDTLDSFFLATKTAEEQQKQIQAMVKIIKEIKQRYPEAKVILNRGFQLLPYVHDQVYAVVIESLYEGWYQDKKSYLPTPENDQKFLWREIDKIKKWNLPVIIIDYLPADKKNLANMLSDKIRAQGLIPWITNNDLTAIYADKLAVFPREILILYYEKKNNLGILSLTSNVLQTGTILEYYGYIPVYFNVKDDPKLSDAVFKGHYAGIISMVNADFANSSGILDYLVTNIQHHVPVLFLGEFPAPLTDKRFTSLGFDLVDSTGTIASLKISKIDKKFIDYESSPSLAPYNFFGLHAVDAQVVLQLKSDKDVTQDAAAITPWGGYVLSEYYMEYLPNGNGYWIINPINFFHKTLRLLDFPVPDTTTENGRRLMSVHIDGDGFAYKANWIGGDIAAVELRDQVLKKYKIPTSVSVITGDLSSNSVYRGIFPQLNEVARTIFALPYVESASHTYSHPFNWQSVLNFKPDIYAENIIMKIPNYKFNLATEIVGSVDYINKYLAPHDKKCQLIFWSGLANVSPKGLAMAYQNGILNINGGNQTNINHHKKSLSSIQPKGAKIGDYYQVFAPIDMDYYYISGFSGALYGYQDVIDTFRMTDVPYRFKPIDVYYHIYSAGNLAMLKALIKVYDWAVAQPVMHIYISDYIKKVLDFYQMTISKINDAWLLYTGGALREIRSVKELGYPDLVKSQNVVGFSENKKDFYIHLGPAKLTLLRYQTTKPTEPYIQEANAKVESFLRKKSELKIVFKGYMPLTFTLANIKSCTVTSKTPLESKINKDGTVSYASDRSSNEIYISC